MAIWGYVRFSSKEQNEARQVEAIRPLVTTESHLLVEKQSGKNFDRPSIKYPDNYEEVINDWKSGRIKSIQAMEILHVKKTSFYKMVNTITKTKL